VPETLITLAGFQELPDHHLSTLTDEQLVDYLRQAREAGRHDAMRPAVGVLVFGYWDNLVGRARLKLPSLADAEEVAGEAVASAIASAFDGKSVGEFRSWLHTILGRRIADHLEARKRRPRTAQLPSEHVADEDVWGAEPSVEFEGEALSAQDCLRQAYEELENGRHRRVIDLYVLGPHAAAETAELVGNGMTEANVHQIASRFHRRVKELLR
jgi:RNA polymerase sigma factor (sigma-70 family)